MSFLDAIILGIIQGLTEFLPVSSSGHLEIMKAIQGQELSGESSMMMTVVLHFATALSTIAVFWKEVVRIIKGLFQFKVNEEFLFSMKIIISMIPAALVGVFFDDFIESFFSGKILLVGLMLIVTGLILFVAERARKTDKSVGFKDAILIGIAQMIAILPGISRSGSTIGTSVILGIDREKAARFSFLMVVPLILGKVAKDVLSPEFSKEMANSEISNSVYAAGFAAAFLVGIIACTWMIKLVKRSKLSYFAYYCFAAGIATICWSFVS
ncbi:MAG: undecaprenyl-diphosphate phosphatase [Flavobacteriales bacterium]|nr:undecaprenyl-diphosphate phosphatase [Flavobacteriales bacterium]